ncbi:unnamed protein product [Meloidogyne enterolobii]|uniref:Uncharacterized protein n=1 Tax=Meloidogyne enterolobii TaxID=390850 RepID=A0ACB0YEB1_MELEN
MPQWQLFFLHSAPHLDPLPTAMASGGGRWDGATSKACAGPGWYWDVGRVACDVKGPERRCR